MKSALLLAVLTEDLPVSLPCRDSERKLAGKKDVFIIARSDYLIGWYIFSYGT